MKIWNQNQSKTNGIKKTTSFNLKKTLASVLQFKKALDFKELDGFAMSLLISQCFTIELDIVVFRRPECGAGAGQVNLIWVNIRGRRCLLWLQSQLQSSSWQSLLVSQCESNRDILHTWNLHIYCLPFECFWNKWFSTLLIFNKINKLFHFIQSKFNISKTFLSLNIIFDIDYSCMSEKFLKVDDYCFTK